MGRATDGSRPPQGGFYRARDPRASPIYRLLEEHFDEFERVYSERYQGRYGFWRPVIRKAVEAFLRCGDVHEGFARARCPDCGEDMWVPLSCKQRCICASCHQKRTLLTGIHVAENVCEAVPHRQFVFTLPKRFRRYFLFNRDLLRKLPNLAWACVLEVYRAALARTDVVPGMVVAIQTFGRLSHWNPHTHCILSDGAFTREGAFIPLPENLETLPFLKLWEKKIFDLLLAEGRITQDVVEQIQSWKFSGFSVDKSVHLPAGDKAGIERLAQYMARCPFSVDRVVSVNEDGQVVYRAEKAAAHRYPLLGDAEGAPGACRNFEVFDPLDFLAQLTQHIPDQGMQLLRYYGWYSNRTKGDRARKTASQGLDDEARIEARLMPHRRAARMRWAALIKRVYEVDPLKCPECGAEMKIISFIERAHQPQVVEKILKHCGLWVPTDARAPPQGADRQQLELELEYVPIDEFLATF